MEKREEVVRAWASHWFTEGYIASNPKEREAWWTELPLLEAACKFTPEEHAIGHYVIREASKVERESNF